MNIYIFTFTCSATLLMIKEIEYVIKEFECKNQKL